MSTSKTERKTDEDKLRAFAKQLASAKSIVGEVLDAWGSLGDEAASLMGATVLPEMYEIADVVANIGWLERACEDAAEELGP